MCTGNERPLTDDDLPRVEHIDEAEAAYQKFIKLYDPQNKSAFKMISALFKVNVEMLDCER